MTAAQWLPDPTGKHELRYWTGDSWTEHVADDGVQATDPLPGDGLPTPAEPVPEHVPTGGGHGQGGRGADGRVDQEG